jgi:hypothetical protein
MGDRKEKKVSMANWRYQEKVDQTLQREIDRKSE